MEYEQSTSKEVVKINFANSGVKTLKGYATCLAVMAVLCALATIASFAALSSDGGSTNVILAISFAVITLSCSVFSAICVVLSSIAKTALYKRALLEKEYEFKEVK